MFTHLTGVCTPRYLLPIAATTASSNTKSELASQGRSTLYPSQRSSPTSPLVGYLPREQTRSRSTSSKKVLGNGRSLFFKQAAADPEYQERIKSLTEEARDPSHAFSLRSRFMHHAWLNLSAEEKESYSKEARSTLVKEKVKKQSRFGRVTAWSAFQRKAAKDPIHRAKIKEITAQYSCEDRMPHVTRYLMSVWKDLSPEERVLLNLEVASIRAKEPFFKEAIEAAIELASLGKEIKEPMNAKSSSVSRGRPTNWMKSIRAAAKKIVNEATLEEQGPPDTFASVTTSSAFLSEATLDTLLRKQADRAVQEREKRHARLEKKRTEQLKLWEHEQQLRKEAQESKSRAANLAQEIEDLKKELRKRERHQQKKIAYESFQRSKAAQDEEETNSRKFLREKWNPFLDIKAN